MKIYINPSIIIRFRYSKGNFTNCFFFTYSELLCFFVVVGCVTLENDLGFFFFSSSIVIA